MKPIRILHCLCRVGGGGVEQKLPLLLDLLPPGEFVHEVVAQDAAGPIADKVRAMGCTIHEIGPAPSLLSPAWYRPAIAIARQFRPDVLHGGVIEGNALAGVIGLALPRAAVLSEETSHPLERKRHTEWFLRLLFKRSRAVIGVSPAVVAYLRERVGVPPDKLRLVNNGVAEQPLPTPRALADLRAGLGLAADAFVIGSVGRMQDDHKRFSDLLRAMPTILAHVPGARLLLVGEGVDRPAYEAMADGLGIRDKMRFAGHVADPGPYYHLLDLFVLPSATEAFGLVLAEAMLAGVPVLGSAVGGIPFVLGEGAGGRLFPPFRPDIIAAEILRLHDDPEERRRLGAAGQARARAEFTAARYASQIAALYRELAGRQ